MTTFTIHFTLSLIFRRVGPYNKFIMSWTTILNDTVSKDKEILLPSLGLIRNIHGMINLWYEGHWTDKWKYIPYITVRHKVLNSWRGKMVTWGHDAYDVREASSFYKKTCWYKKFAYPPPPAATWKIHPRPITLPNTKFLFPYLLPT